MKQQELKDLKRDLLKMYENISVNYTNLDEDSGAILLALHAAICTVTNRIEIKYK